MGRVCSSKIIKEIYALEDRFDYVDLGRLRFGIKYSLASPGVD